MNRRTAQDLQAAYCKLFAHFGPQHWWPGKTPFEVIVGAILTQNTNWGNVEKAIANLRSHRLLSPIKLKKISVSRLAVLIRPAGYFNVKAKRLKNFIDFFFAHYNGSIRAMSKKPWPALRAQLLSVNGIGEETADSILLYALNKPVFVVDTYTRRILSRHKMISPDSDYQTIQKLFMDNLPCRRALFNEYHALLVCVGKQMCRTNPVCAGCPLKHFRGVPC